jgi:hypothetical protein
VIPIENGTFMISKSEWGIEHTGATVKADALKEAGAFCMKQQKDPEAVNTSQQDMVPFKSEAQAEVEFRHRFLLREYRSRGAPFQPHRGETARPRSCR